MKAEQIQNPKWKALWSSFGKTAYDSLNKLPIYNELLEKTANALISCYKVLDLGCGTGNLSIMLAKHGKIVYGIDNSKGMLCKAREKIRLNKEIKGSLFIQKHDLANKLDFPDYYFDGVACINVLFNFSNPLPIIQESYRALKKEGLFVVSGPLAGMDFSVFSAYLADFQHDKGIKKVFSYNQKLKKEGGMPFTPTENELEKLLQKNKFKILSKDRAYLNQSYFFIAKKA